MELVLHFLLMTTKKMINIHLNLDSAPISWNKLKQHCWYPKHTRRCSSILRLPWLSNLMHRKFCIFQLIVKAEVLLECLTYLFISWPLSSTGVEWYVLQWWVFSFDLQTLRNANIIPEYCIHVFLAWSNLEIIAKRQCSVFRWRSYYCHRLLCLSSFIHIILVAILRNGAIPVAS